MKQDPGKSSRLRESSYRVTILVVVISCHLGLLLLLLRPVTFYRGTTPVVRNNYPQVLKLRLFQPPQASSPRQALPTRRLIAPAVHSHRTLTARSPTPPAVQPAAHVDMQPYETRSTNAPPVDRNEEASSRDGGFQARLRHAQDAYSVRGVPGSDTPAAPGIHLVDPMQQGIGAVMRTAQRAFGIASRHCIDVDVWRHLTAQALSARHISSDEVDRVDEKYRCNEPPGLHF